MSNTTGQQLVAVGHGALYRNTASNNVAIGYESMWYNTSGANNTAVGSDSLEANTTGAYNVAMGVNALTANTTAVNNVAMGVNALTANTTGANSTAIGTNALAANTTNSHNTAVGQNALNSTTGYTNTAIGKDAGNSITSGNLNICIGYNAQPTSAGANTQATIGDSQIGALRCNVQTIGSLSDQRDKTEIVDSPYGLTFINTVQPRQFKWATRDGNTKDGKTRLGFIAQELLTATDGNNAVLDLVLDENPNKLEATYGNLLPIMVKAIQELSTKNDALEARITALES